MISCSLPFYYWRECELFYLLKKLLIYIKKFHIVLYLFTKSDMLNIRKHGGEKHGKNSKY